MSSGTLAKLPLFSRFVVSLENHPSTALSQEACVGVKCRWKRGWLLSHRSTSSVEWALAGSAGTKPGAPVRTARKASPRIPKAPTSPSPDVVKQVAIQQTLQDQASAALAPAQPLHKLAPGEAVILNVGEEHVETATNVYGKIVLERHKRPT